jgi:hypothetical protein
MNTAKAERNVILALQLKLLTIWDSKTVKLLRYWIPVLFVMAVPAFVAWELQGMRFQFGNDVTNWIAGYMLLTVAWKHVAGKILSNKKK